MSDRMKRRGLLKLVGGALGAAAFVRAAAPLAALRDELSLEELLQRHYKELGPEQRAALIERLEAWTSDHYGAHVDIADPQPLEGVEFGYALNLTTCLGCRQCAQACHRENNHDRAYDCSYITVTEMEKGSLDLAKGDSDYDHPVRAPDKFYMPSQCQQCAEPPCVNVCPVKATWREPDGLVVIDYDWCIGCRYCQAACPYHARRFNWSRPQLAPEEVNPDQALLSNRIRSRGVMEKCTFCLHRVRRGRLPACLEACPAGARVFGNLLDADSPIRAVIENKRVYVLKEDLGTVPSFYYYFAE